MTVQRIVNSTAPGVPVSSCRADPTNAFAAVLDEAATTGPDIASGRSVAARQAIAAFDLRLIPTDPAAAGAFAEGARQVSTAQGLPEGIYDFTYITPRQMTIVGGALIAKGIVKPSALAGALDLVGQADASDEPINVFAYLHQQAGQNEKTAGGMAVAFQQKASTAILTRLHGEWGIPITYDDNYPTAPHSLTAEEVGIKMKEAIAAFVKEASLTPAQRIRRDVLKDMKITEDDLKAMPPADRELAEKTIGEEVARRLEKLGLDRNDRSRAAGTALSTMTAE